MRKSCFSFGDDDCDELADRNQRIWIWILLLVSGGWQELLNTTTLAAFPLARVFQVETLAIVQQPTNQPTVHGRRLRKSPSSAPTTQMLAAQQAAIN